MESKKTWSGWLGCNSSKRDSETNWETAIFTASPSPFRKLSNFFSVSYGKPDIEKGEMAFTQYKHSPWSKLLSLICFLLHLGVLFGIYYFLLTLLSVGSYRQCRRWNGNGHCAVSAWNTWTAGIPEQIHKEGTTDPIQRVQKCKWTCLYSNTLIKIRSDFSDT